MSSPHFGNPAQAAKSAEHKRSFWQPWMLPALIIVLGMAEITVLTLIGANYGYGWVFFIILAGIVIAFALLLAAGQQSISRLVSVLKALRGSGSISKHLSKPVFTLFAAILFFFPGVITDVFALFLLITPVQRKMVDKTGLSSDKFRQQGALFGGSRQGVIQGEVIIDSRTNRSQSGSSDATKKTPPALEGDVL